MHSQKITVIAGALLCVSIRVLSAANNEEMTQGRSLGMNCLICHSPLARDSNAIPSLRGKSSEFIRQRLIEFKKDQGDPTIMNRIAKAYSDEQLSDIAEYLSQHR